jgi:phosphoglycerol transferase MdoB-like AlkP superfamily enzyme
MSLRLLLLSQHLPPHLQTLNHLPRSVSVRLLLLLLLLLAATSLQSVRLMLLLLLAPISLQSVRLMLLLPLLLLTHPIYAGTCAAPRDVFAIESDTEESTKCWAAFAAAVAAAAAAELPRCRWHMQRRGRKKCIM